VADTYYTPSGTEHLQQTANEPAEEIVAERVFAGDHIHTFSKDLGVRCMLWDGNDLTWENVPRNEKCKKETASE
jgi:hypothetical protein